MTSEREPVDAMSKTLEGTIDNKGFRDECERLENILAKTESQYRADIAAPVDDAVLIAEAERLARESGYAYGYMQRRIRDAHLIRLAREGWQPPAPEPDRATKLWSELLDFDDPNDERDAIDLIQTAFDELRAEWEAERPVIDVPSSRAVAWANYARNMGYKSKNEHAASAFILQLAKGPSQ